MKEFIEQIKELIAMQIQIAYLKRISKELKNLNKIKMKNIVQQEYVEFLYAEYEKMYGEDLRKIGNKYERL